MITLPRVLGSYTNLSNASSSHSIASPINARNLLAYCSGSQVEIPSTLPPYLTVLAALAVIFFTPGTK